MTYPSSVRLNALRFAVTIALAGLGLLGYVSVVRWTALPSTPVAAVVTGAVLLAQWKIYTTRAADQHPS